MSGRRLYINHVTPDQCSFGEPAATTPITSGISLSREGSVRYLTGQSVDVAAPRSACLHCCDTAVSRFFDFQRNLFPDEDLRPVLDRRINSPRVVECGGGGSEPYEEYLVLG